MTAIALVGCSRGELSQQALTSVGPSIVGGVEATPQEFSFMASLQTRGQAFCGGSLIAPNLVLTAAHCIHPRFPIQQILFNLHDQRERSEAIIRKPKKIILHPEFDSNTMHFDMALIELDEAVDLEPIELNLFDLNQHAEPSEIEFTIMGWGAVKENGNSSRYLLKTQVPFVTKASCKEAYANFGEDALTDAMFCAGYVEGGKDTCQGDSGGPIIFFDLNDRPVLAGVVSWGQGCARPNAYGVYADVQKALLWILEGTL